MASPTSTGGAGIHLESWIAAYYLATTLLAGAVRGLPSGAIATGIRLQRAYQDKPLDDVIVSATNATGACTLSLQAKRTLAVGDNELFLEVLNQCWQTFDSPEFRPGQDRFGAAVGIPDRRFEQAGRKVLAWARQHADAEEFFGLIATKDVASDDMRAFIGFIRAGLKKVSGGPVANETTVRFLSHFVVLYFDFEQVDESANRVEITDRLRYALPPDECQHAPDLWTALVDIADRAKPAAGGLDRATLVEELQARFKLAGQRHMQGDLERLQQLSARALDDIRTSLAGIRLARPKLTTELENNLTQARLVEVVGEAGVGKSVLLKGLAETQLLEGPTLVLSAKRMPAGAPGWEGLASHWHIATPLAELVTELACVGHPCLFIDGIDRIEDLGAWLAINDLLRAIRASASADRWTVILSARSNSLGYRTHLDLGEIESNAERITVSDLEASEIEQVATANPHVAALIAPGGKASSLASRAFLLDFLIRAKDIGNPGQQPFSEIDLMNSLWTGAASGDNLAAGLVLARQDLLLKLGHQRLTQPSKPLTSIGLDNDALISLVDDDLLRHDLSTRKLSFSHDILEDWTLCQALNHEKRGLATIIDGLGQPLWLLDAVQLLAQQRLETEPTADAWQALIDQLSQPPLQPRWRRAVLTAALQSTRASELLAKVTDRLWREDGDLLAELMTALRTIEVDPDPKALDSKLFPDYDDATRMRLAHDWAVPRLRSWRHFFPWLIPKLTELPPTRVEEATRVLHTWARSFHIFPNWSAVRIAQWAIEWLERIETTEDRGSYFQVQDQLGQMGVNYDDRDALRDRFRLLIVVAADGAGGKVARYLKTVTASPRHKGVKFFVEHSNWLVSSMPEELVDFLLTVMLPKWSHDRRSFGRVQSLNTLGIAFDQQYFQSSHLRPPFLELLRQHPDQGIRLINGLCNHAMQVWRAILRHERDSTPLPVCITFPWGEQEFWGHCREYTWFRGIGPGPYPVESALMALEVWMEEQFEAGTDLETIFQRVLDGNHCVGALGACVSLALAHPEESLKAALPLATCPQLWSWDINRRVEESPERMPNLIGMPKDRPFLAQVAERNRLPHRRSMLRELAIYYLTASDPQTRAEFQQRLADLDNTDLPFEFAEQREDPATADEMRDRIRRMQAEANPKNYSTTAMEDGEHVRIDYSPPTDLIPSARELEDQQERGRSRRVALWAEQSLEDNSPLSDLTLDEAVTIAQQLDLPDLFNQPLSSEEFERRHRAGAVAGAAAMAIKFGDPSNQQFAWATEVLQRCLSTPLDNDSMIFADSQVMFHPVVTGATALTALIERGLSTEQDRQAVLALVCHPLLKVKKAIYQGLSACWEQQPLLCWQAFVLGMRLSLEARELLYQREDSRSLAPAEAEQQWLDAIHATIEKDWHAGQYSTLPSIPLPWMEDPQADPGSVEPPWRESDTAFLWDIAPIVLTSQPLPALLAIPGQRQSVIRLASELLDWTIMDAAPPFDDHFGGHAYEWRPSFMEWCARLTEYLSPPESESIIITPIAQAFRRKEGENLLQSLMFSFIRQRFSQDHLPDDATIEVWNQLCEPLFEHAKRNQSAGRAWIAQGYDQCVALGVFSYGGYSMFEHPWPTLEAAKPMVARWVEEFGETARFYTPLTVFLTGAGQGLFPEPALDWLYRIVVAKKADQRFWLANDNGSKTAALIAQLLDTHEDAITNDADKVTQLVEISDILIATGVRQASQIQQRLAALSKREP